MVEFTTSSGAIYLVDEKNKKYIRKAGPTSDGIRDGFYDNWHEFETHTAIVVAALVYFFQPDGMYSRTTPVEEIREDPEVKEIDVS